MDDLIDRDILMAKMLLQHEDYHRQGATDMALGYGSAICDVKQAPAVDAEPVKRGRWIERHHTYSDEEAPIEEWQSAKCSVCGKYHTTPYMYYFTDYHFCPHCGAKMEGKDDDDQ